MEDNNKKKPDFKPLQVYEILTNDVGDVILAKNGKPCICPFRGRYAGIPAKTTLLENPTQQGMTFVSEHCTSQCPHFRAYIDDESYVSIHITCSGKDVSYYTQTQVKIEPTN